MLITSYKMKSFIFVVAVICSAAFVSAEMHCKAGDIDIPKEWIDMEDPCVTSMRNHIMEELKAAMTYMAMGAHFARDSVNKLGFAKFFFDAASEERQHAIKLISYLLMRGELTSRIGELIDYNSLFPRGANSWENGLNALKDALRLEASVTKKIRNVIGICEQGANDYHLSDYLTGDFLTEQYEGQRDIAGKISTLEKMNREHGALGEFLFDKKLLDKQVL